MAEAQEETVGQVAKVPQEKEASPVEKDVVKANGELPTSEQSAEIVGKGKEDPTLSSTAEGPAAAENGESAIPSEEAKDIDGLSHPKEASSPTEEVTESAKANDESPTGLDAEQGIEENFLSQVDSGKEDAVEAQTSPDVVEAEGEAPNSGKTEKELPAEGIPAADEPEGAEPSEKTEEAEKTAEKAEENPESVGHKEQVEEAPKPADILETSEANRAGQEETANPGETTQTDEPKTDVTGEGTPEVVDTTKTDEAGTQVSEGEAPKSADAGETEAVVGGEEETTPRSEEATEEEVPKIEETNKTDEPSGAEFAEEEIPRTSGPNVPEVPAEKIPKSVKTTDTEEPSAPEVAGEETPKTLEATDTEETRAPEVAAERNTKTLESTETDDPSVTGVAAENIPETLESTETEGPSVPKVAAEEDPKALESTETEEPSVPEVAAEEIPKTDSLEPQVAEDETPNPSEIDEPKPADVVVDEKKEDPGDNTLTAAENSAAAARESTSTVGEVGEPAKVGEGTPEEEVLATPSPSPVEQEPPAVDAEEPVKPKSFFGVILKHVGLNGKSVDIQPKQEDSGQEPEANLPAVITEQETSGDAAPSALSEEKDVGPKEVEQETKGDAAPSALSEEKDVGPKEVEQETRGDAAPSALSEEKDVGPKEVEQETSGDAAPSALSEEKDVGPEEVEQETSGDAAPSALSEKKDVGPKEVEEAPGAEMESETVPKEVSPEASENTTTETFESVEQGNVDDSSKEGGIPTSAVEEKEIPQPEASTESPASTPEDASTEPSSTAEEAPEVKETHNVEEPIETPITAAEDTIDRLTEETSKGAETDDTVAEKSAGEDGSALEKQPDLSVSIPKQGEATASEGETHEDGGLTTPRGTPLMQRVEQLEQKLAQLEGRQSPRSDFASTGNTTPRSSIDSRPIKHSTRYVLEETGSKGTLLERVAALEQKLALINLHPPPINGQLTTPVATVSEDASTEPDSKSAESRTREWTPSGADDEKAPQTNFKEAFKAAEDPAKPNTEEKPPQDVAPVKTKPMAPVRNNSLTERKIKAKAAVGKVKGIFAGCFAPKKTGT